MKVLSIDGRAVDAGLDELGVAHLGPLLPPDDCRSQRAQGHGYVFTTRDRPLRTPRGWASAPMRHGVSVVRSGRRHALGLIFHDAT